MVKITLDIPANKLQRVKDAVKTLYPIPKIEENDVMVPEFTDEEWIKERIRRQVIEWIHTAETRAAKEAANVDRDNTIIS